MKCFWSVSWKTNFIFSLEVSAWGSFSCQCLLLWKQKIKIVSLVRVRAVNHRFYDLGKEREEDKNIKRLHSSCRDISFNRSRRFIVNMTFPPLEICCYAVLRHLSNKAQGTICAWIFPFCQSLKFFCRPTAMKFVFLTCFYSIFLMMEDVKRTKN